MATVRKIKRRIDSIKNIRQITKAMNMIASAKIQKAQAKLSSLAPYAEALDGIVKNLVVRCERESHPLLSRREIKNSLLIAITSDRGLCGAFNANVTDTAVKLIDKSSYPVRLILVGRKGISYLGHSNYEFVDSFRMPDPPDMELCKSIAEKIALSYAQGEYDEIHLLFNEFITISKQKVKKLKILPIEAEKPTGYITDYLYEPVREKVLDEILPHNLETQLYYAMLDSTAAEHAARMLAMDNATKNAGDMIDELILFFNKARQALITREMIEITTSLEVIAKAG